MEKGEFDGTLKKERYKERETEYEAGGQEEGDEKEEQGTVGNGVYAGRQLMANPLAGGRRRHQSRPSSGLSTPESDLQSWCLVLSQTDSLHRRCCCC